MSNKCGIYKIKNKANNKLYIGQSVNIRTRKNSHLSSLKNNTHYNTHLQRAFNKYGVENFEFTVIEYCDQDMLYERENFWIGHYQTYDFELGYNATIPSVGDEKFRFSEETRKKMSDGRTVFEDEELISYLQEFYYHYGRVPTQRDLVNNNYPVYTVYVKRFGDFKNALIEADLYDYCDTKSLFSRKEYTREDILNLFASFIEKNNRYPNKQEQRKSFENNLPSHNAVIKLFGSTSELKKQLNFDDDKILEIEKREALNSLKFLYEQDGFITSRTIDKSPITRSVRYYSNNFGSLVKAYELAGINN